jgi:hypothetical protein
LIGRRSPSADAANIDDLNLKRFRTNGDGQALSRLRRSGSTTVICGPADA